MINDFSSSNPAPGRWKGGMNGKAHESCVRGRIVDRAYLQLPLLCRPG
ncbi:unnamed protein product [Spirodela intermedia]|uniref:Uncharacterized protein n=2 Tax=Spirodela intermedia TaxID=51605 RepID=A0A7I8KDZ2_SPIIN|nr:unnamed protein product [Spirodela intermedia]CAA6659140.1 unnamed protein product [Spirodela intermedia]CAA7395444.1 unnamed protein product [Spirodela intermedia]